MSETAAKEFIAKVQSDPSIREALAERAGSGAMDGVLSLANEHGMEFTREELVAAYAANLEERGYSKEDVEDMTSGASDPASYFVKPGSYKKSDSDAAYY